jgi:hypothetical protein
MAISIQAGLLKRRLPLDRHCETPLVARTNCKYATAPNLSPYIPPASATKSQPRRRSRAGCSPQISSTAFQATLKQSVRLFCPQKNVACSQDAICQAASNLHWKRIQHQLRGYTFKLKRAGRELGKTMVSASEASTATELPSFLPEEAQALEDENAQEMAKRIRRLPVEVS